MARFINPQNGYVEEVGYGRAMLFTLLFGCFYFLYKGVWIHALIAFGLALLTHGISWFIYPFFAPAVIEKHYLRAGWKTESSPANTQ